MAGVEPMIEPSCPCCPNGDPSCDPGEAGLEIAGELGGPSVGAAGWAGEGLWPNITIACASD